MVEVAVFRTRFLVGAKTTFIAAGHPNSNGPVVIGKLWAEMSKQFFAQDFDREEFPVGIGAMWPTDSGVHGEMTYFAGYEVNAFPESLEELESLELTAGNYAFVAHTDGMATLSQTVERFYTQDLPTSGLASRWGMDLEVYQDPDGSGMPQTILIAAPVQ
jgi:predicted transcriptional regulator YdeE